MLLRRRGDGSTGRARLIPSDDGRWRWPMTMALPIRPPLSSATTLGYRVAMAEIVNLRLARKARARTEAEGKAAANRAAHGQTKAERGED
jgi:hypothetical protein